MRQDTLRLILVDAKTRLINRLIESLGEWFDYIVHTPKDISQTLNLLAEPDRRYSVVLINDFDDGKDALTLIRQIHEFFPNIPVILFCVGSERGMDAIKAGAFRYFTRNFPAEELVLTIQTASRLARRSEVLESLYSSGKTITAGLELEQTLQTITEQALYIVGEQPDLRNCFSHIALTDDEGRLRFISASNAEMRKRLREAGAEIVLTGSSSQIGIAGRAILTSSSQNVGNVQLDPDYIAVLSEKELIHSQVSVPLIADHEVIGALSIEHSDYHAFSEEDVTFLEMLAAQAAIAFQNARSFQEASNGREYLQSLYRASSAIVFSSNPDEVLRSILESVRVAHSASSAVVMFTNEKNQIDETLASDFLPLLKDYNGHGPGNISEQVLNNGQPQYIEDIAVLENNSAVTALFDPDIKSAVCLPLMLLNKKIGVLWLLYRDQRTFNHSERKTLSIYANQAAIAYNYARQAREKLEQEKRAREASLAVAQVSALGHMEDTLNAIVAGAISVLKCDTASVYTFNEARQRFEYFTAEGFSQVPPVNSTQLHPDSIVWKLINLPASDTVYIVEDTSQDNQLVTEFVREEKISATLAIQLRSKDKRVGVLFTNYRNPRHFSQQDKEDAQLFANHAAIALTNSQLYESSQKRYMVLDKLLEASKEISGTASLDETLQKIVDRALDFISNGDQTGQSISYIGLVEGQRLNFITSSPRYMLRDIQEVSRYINLNSADQSKISISGRAALLRQTQLTTRVEGDPNYLAIRPDIQSQLSVPLMFAGRAIGVLSIEHIAPNAFSIEDVQNIELLAATAATAIRKARRIDTLNILHEASQIINGNLDQEYMLNQIVRQALRIVHASFEEGGFSHISLVEDNRLHFISASKPQSLELLRLAEDKIDLNLIETPVSISGRAAINKSTIYVKNVGTEPDYFLIEEQINSQLSVPFSLGHEVVGVLSIEHPEVDPFTDEDIANVEALATTAALAIKNSRIYGQLNTSYDVQKLLVMNNVEASVLNHSLTSDAAVILDKVDHCRKLLHKLKPSSEVLKELEVIDEIARKILVMKRTSVHKTENNIELQNFNQLVRRFCSFYNSFLFDKVLDEHYDARLDQALVRVNGGLLKEALEILANNAVRAISELPHGKLTITTRYNCGENLHWGEIEIADNGCGIPASIKAKLFIEPVSHTSNGKPGGQQGIGLLLAKNIVEHYHGIIDCRTNFPRGTCMVISLPLVNTALL